jgi:hypothetical protein
MNSPTDLISEVTYLLNLRRGEWQQIAADQASGVSYSWLSKFANGHIENPGYVTLRTLRDYLLVPPAKQEPTATQEVRDAA